MATIMVNLTPHDLVVYDEMGEEEITRLPRAGEMARVETQAKEVGEFSLNGHSVPLVETSFGDVVNLPEEKDGTIYVVSILVVQAVRDLRDDVVAPDTGPASVVRDDGGNILGVRRFTR